jgi:hypothetical protein
VIFFLLSTDDTEGEYCRMTVTASVDMYTLNFYFTYHTA